MLHGLRKSLQKFKREIPHTSYPPSITLMALFDPKKRFIPGVNSYGLPKTPPGQGATVRFPVLTDGSTPAVRIKDWRFRVLGEVGVEIVWTWEDFTKFPQTTLRADFHCVTRRSRYDDDWTGVLFKDLITFIKLKPSARYVVQHAYGGYTTNLPLDVMVDEDVILAHRFNG